MLPPREDPMLHHLLTWPTFGTSYEGGCWGLIILNYWQQGPYDCLQQPGGSIPRLSPTGFCSQCSTCRHPLIITCFPLFEFKLPRLYFATVVGPSVPTPNVDYYTEWGAWSLNSGPTQSWPVPRFVVVCPIRVYVTVHVLAVTHPSINLGKHCLTSVIGLSMVTVC